MAQGLDREVQQVVELVVLIHDTRWSGLALLTVEFTAERLVLRLGRRGAEDTFERIASSNSGKFRLLTLALGGRKGLVDTGGWGTR